MSGSKAEANWAHNNRSLLFLVSVAAGVALAPAAAGRRVGAARRPRRPRLLFELQPLRRNLVMRADYDKQHKPADVFCSPPSEARS
ncbi:hypothetical protein SETIT_1G356400v2 [Setaria italica]|uniref:Uncharacterized protein n=1 Tax=Setaria italica TaxID=4555 RepID=K3YX79_SETIT|nr:hypothetical protein SETIT_1G356400v2 [Setaria italica]